MLDLKNPTMQWGGALWYWARFAGDMAVIASLLREGVPIPLECATLLADILEGKLKPRAA